MPMATKVNPITCAEVLAQFENPVANGLAVTQDTSLQTLEADANLSLGLLVSQGLEPIGNWLRPIGSLVTKYFDHFA